MCIFDTQVVLQSYLLVSVLTATEIREVQCLQQDAKNKGNASLFTVL
jgi:hypothetical protein